MLNVEREGALLRVNINRPEVRNALNDELIGSIDQLFSTVSSEIRVIVIAGEGSAFCAGGDLEWMRKAAGYSEAENIADAMRVSKMFSAIRNCHAVTVASVHGSAMGGGCGIISACDIAIATEEAKFAFSEVKLGLIPATISPFVIDRIGKGHARALFVTGEVFDARHAFAIGLVHEVVALGERDRAVNRKIRAVLAASPQAIVGAKALVNDAPLSAEETAKRLASARASDDGKAGIAAFLNKTKPPFVSDMD
jgi:enoyl-CoA hydratase/carnithine racemase